MVLPIWIEKKSRARTLGLVVEGLIPFELAHQIEQAFLPASLDELLQRARDRRLLGAFTAHFESAFDQIGVERKIGSHV